MDIHDEVEMIMWQTLLTPDKKFFECQSCGAVVMSQYTHVQWHRERDAMLTESRPSEERNL